MSDPAKIAVLAAVLLLAYAGMRAGWARRTARATTVVPALPDVPPLGEPVLGPLEATYLATAVADDRLARVAAHGLAVRARAGVQVHEEGVLVRRRGAADLFVPVGAIGGVTRASGMAGTAMGTDRVVVLRWELGGVALDTGLLPRHPDDAARLVAEVGARLRPAATPSEASAGHTDDATEGSPA